MIVQDTSAVQPILESYFLTLDATLIIISTNNSTAIHCLLL